MQLAKDKALSQALRPWIYGQVVEAKTAATVLACMVIFILVMKLKIDVYVFYYKHQFLQNIGKNWFPNYVYGAS